jgi:hypothetical protein
MGILSIIENTLLLHSHIITYGNASSLEITERIREEIERMWNEPNGRVLVHDREYTLIFRITAEWKPGIEDLEIVSNLEPANNYFRIEEFAIGNISFVDGIKCNSGYFKLENLYAGSTTAAHEYGHTLGLDHPEDLDLRGKGVPGIMFPRGTLVDPPYQYEADKPAGSKGGTLYPIHRKVLQEDIESLKIDNLEFNNGTAIIGEFTNVWHADHATMRQDPSSPL